MATITVGSTTITPMLVLNPDRSRASRNVLIEPIDSTSPYVSLAESATPTQQLEVLFANAAEAQAALDLVSAGLPIAIVTGDRDFTCVLVEGAEARIDRPTENPIRRVLTAEVREL